jgi:endogenous inhibitor of DNA gyrase (YacG/DUF329 family)
MVSPVPIAPAANSLAYKRQIASALMKKARRQQRPLPTRRGGNPIDLLTWNCRYRQQLRPGEWFDLPHHKYLVDMFAEVAREIVYMKAGQIGVSELLISYALHACDQRSADVLYLMPTNTDVSDFGQSRFGPALEASPYLASIVVGASASKNQRGADKVTLKRIRENFLYLRGGSVGNDGRARQLKSIPVDVLVGDEIDEMDERAMPIGRKRLGHSPIKEVRQASTPTYHGVGIHAQWELSDQREWFVPCPHCGKWQQLDINNIVQVWDDLGRPIVWHGQEDDRAYIACTRCGKEVDRLAKGEWVPKYPGRSIVGFHPTKLMSGHTPLLAVVLNFNTVDETARREAFNQDLGLPYTPKGGRLTEEDLRACEREFAHGPLDYDAGAAMGVDVGKLLHVVIRARPDGKGERRQLFAGAVMNFDEVSRLMQQYQVNTCVVDALPETRSARAFQAEHKDKKVWLCHYVSAESGAKKSGPVQWDARHGNVNADRTWTLDITFSRFYDKSNVLPANIKSVADYHKHLLEPTRVVHEKPDGTVVGKYVGDGDDHFAHAENYCAIAAMRPTGWAR